LDENSKNLNEENIYECKLRGTLKVKNDKMNCIIGDCVEFDEKEKVIEKIEKRKNFLYRPLIANIDFIGILFAIKSPNFDFINFQKMLLNANSQNIPVVLILSKIDLVSEEELEEFLNKFSEFSGLSSYNADYEDIKNSDFVITAGSFLRHESPVTSFKLNNALKMNKAAGIYFHHIADEIVKKYSKNFIYVTHEAGELEQILLAASKPVFVTTLMALLSNFCIKGLSACTSPNEQA